MPLPYPTCPAEIQGLPGGEYEWGGGQGGCSSGERASRPAGLLDARPDGDAARYVRLISFTRGQRQGKGLDGLDGLGHTGAAAARCRVPWATITRIISAARPPTTASLECRGAGLNLYYASSARSVKKGCRARRTLS